MSKDVVLVKIKGILPVNNGEAVFLGNKQKVFVIQIERTMGEVIKMFIQNKPKQRPLTHDLMIQVFRGFGVEVDRVVITELRGTTYYARMILQQRNELARKVVELDARPSDCIALATAQKKPIYIASELFEQVEDMSHILDDIKKSSEGTEET
ncbi:MAG: bifunctional nuclease family protein [Verrucomicrobiota bacterium]|nr:bifunctional nuclease family protein [Verrucomicrobiota bacterium]